MVYQTKVTDKFQITIPKKLREAYAVRAGSTLSLLPRENCIEIAAPKKIENIAEKLYGVAHFKKDAVKAIHELRGAHR